MTLSTAVAAGSVGCGVDQVSGGVSPGPEVYNSETGGEDGGRDLGGTDCNFAKFETGGGKVTLADFIYLKLIINLYLTNIVSSRLTRTK